jgi:hypothetical protein
MLRMLFLNVTISGPRHLDANAQIGRPGANSSIVPITVAFLTFFHLLYSTTNKV